MSMVATVCHEIRSTQANTQRLFDGRKSSIAKSYDSLHCSQSLIRAADRFLPPTDLLLSPYFLLQTLEVDGCWEDRRELCANTGAHLDSYRRTLCYHQEL